MLTEMRLNVNKKMAEKTGFEPAEELTPSTL